MQDALITAKQRGRRHRQYKPRWNVTDPLESAMPTFSVGFQFFTDI
jgi:hypothetical protein